MYKYVVCFFNKKNEVVATYDNVDAWSNFEAYAEVKSDFTSWFTEQYSYLTERLNEDW